MPSERSASVKVFLIALAILTMLAIVVFALAGSGGKRNAAPTEQLPDAPRP